MLHQVKCKCGTSRTQCVQKTERGVETVALQRRQAVVHEDGIGEREQGIQRITCRPSLAAGPFKVVLLLANEIAEYLEVPRRTLTFASAHLIVGLHALGIDESQ
jgi:activator of 2-hydroxyglutaryl-CoA dehydratase